MSQKEKATAEEKLRVIELYLGGKVGCTEAGSIAGVDRATIRRWASRYKTDGPAGFLPKKCNQSYSKEVKISAVLDYQSGQGTTQDICEKYAIRNTRQAVRVLSEEQSFSVWTLCDILQTTRVGQKPQYSRE